MPSAALAHDALAELQTRQYVRLESKSVFGVEFSAVTFQSERDVDFSLLQFTGTVTPCTATGLCEETATPIRTTEKFIQNIRFVVRPL